MVRKIYPITAEMIDRAEANTARNVPKYLEEYRRKAASEKGYDDDPDKSLSPELKEKAARLAEEYRYQLKTELDWL